jgi:hypothetical protein
MATTLFTSNSNKTAEVAATGSTFVLPRNCWGQKIDKPLTLIYTNGYYFIDHKNKSTSERNLLKLLDPHSSCQELVLDRR